MILQADSVLLGRKGTMRPTASGLSRIAWKEWQTEAWRRISGFSGPSSMPNTEQTVEDSGEDEDEGEQIAQKLEVAIQHVNFGGAHCGGKGI